jgi:hypothetical protein
MKYIQRLIEKTIEQQKKYMNVINVTGVKFSGKSECCKHFCNSIFDISDGTGNHSNEKKAKLNPLALFEGEYPILIDE